MRTAVPPGDWVGTAPQGSSRRSPRQGSALVASGGGLVALIATIRKRLLRIYRVMTVDWPSGNGIHIMTDGVYAVACITTGERVITFSETSWKRLSYSVQKSCSLESTGYVVRLTMLTLTCFIPRQMVMMCLHPHNAHQNWHCFCKWYTPHLSVAVL